MDESIFYIAAPAAFFGTALLILGLTFLKKSKVLVIATQEIEELLSAKPVDQRIAEIQTEISYIENKLKIGSTTHKTLKITLSTAEEKVKQIEVGLYPPTFGFKDSEELKNLIRHQHTEQHRLIETDKAVGAHASWTWYGDSKVGSEMVRDYKHLILRAFNSEFDALRKKLTYRNSKTTIDRVWKIREQLEKLGETVGCYITAEYMEQKLAELSSWESEILKQEEIKKATKEQKKILRESAKQERDDTEEIEDEIEYRQSDLKRARKIAFELSGIDAETALAEIKKLEGEISALEQNLSRSSSQAQITRAGYIYVISNIGNFGDGILKIGMTRRLEPLDRVRELGDASVPFRFDVHALGFVQDAPSLERKLHNKFSDRRVNTENNRKEFFKITPTEAEEAFRDLEIEAEWFYEAEAKEFRESMLIRRALESSRQEVKAESENFPEEI